MVRQLKKKPRTYTLKNCQNDSPMKKENVLSHIGVAEIFFKNALL